MTKNLQNKKKFEKSPKKDGGADAKLVYFFTRPKIPGVKLGHNLYT